MLIRMVVVQATVKRIGGSILLAVPPAEARELHLKEGQRVAVFIPTAEVSAFGAYRDLDLTSNLRSSRVDPDRDA